VRLEPNEVCHIRSTKLKKVYGDLLESCGEKLINEGNIVNYGCLRQAAFF
jgi:hypothetical protein